MLLTETFGQHGPIANRIVGYHLVHNACLGSFYPRRSRWQGFVKKTDATRRSRWCRCSGPLNSRGLRRPRRRSGNCWGFHCSGIRIPRDGNLLLHRHRQAEALEPLQGGRGLLLLLLLLRWQLLHLRDLVLCLLGRFGKYHGRSVSWAWRWRGESSRRKFDANTWDRSRGRGADLHRAGGRGQPRPRPRGVQGRGGRQRLGAGLQPLVVVNLNIKLSTRFREMFTILGEGPYRKLVHKSSLLRIL